jgi:N-acyl-D-amino-acid deacylase
VPFVPSTAGVDAGRLGLGGRGGLAPGAPADLVVADADGRPRHVLVNGLLALRDGQPTGRHAGRALRLEPG